MFRPGDKIQFKSYSSTYLGTVDKSDCIYVWCGDWTMVGGGYIGNGKAEFSGCSLITPPSVAIALFLED